MIFFLKIKYFFSKKPRWSFNKRYGKNDFCLQIQNLHKCRFLREMPVILGRDDFFCQNVHCDMWQWWRKRVRQCFANRKSVEVSGLIKFDSVLVCPSDFSYGLIAQCSHYHDPPNFRQCLVSNFLERASFMPNPYDNTLSLTTQVKVHFN